MNNSEVVLKLFQEIHQSILESYCIENDKSSILKNHSDFDFFARNRCPEWHRLLNFDDEILLQYFDFGVFNHKLNVACFDYHHEKMQEVLGNE